MSTTTPHWALSTAEAICDRAKSAGRAMTQTERDEVHHLIDAARNEHQDANDWKAIGDQIDEIRGGNAGPGSFMHALRAANFDFRSNPTVEIPLAAAMFKAPTVPAVTDINRTTPFIAPLGQDTRFLHPHLPQEDVGDATSVQFFKQTGARTITGTVERALTAATDKAQLAVTLAIVNAAMVQGAILIDAIPNAVLESLNMSRQFFESEGRFQIAKAIDAHVMAAIVAAAPPFGTTGTTLVDKLRNGIASMRRPVSSRTSPFSTPPMRRRLT